MIDTPVLTNCTNCGSDDLKWMPWVSSAAPVAINRLGVGDVTSSFVLGCEWCSETVKVVSAEAVADVLNKRGIDAQEVY